MDGIIQSILNVLTFLKAALTWIMDGVKFVGMFLLYQAWDIFLTIVTIMLQSINIGQNLVNIATYIVDLPPQVVYIINQIGLGSAISILIWAIGLRLLLNLIPAAFTRI